MASFARAMDAAEGRKTHCRDPKARSPGHTAGFTGFTRDTRAVRRHPTFLILAAVFAMAAVSAYAQAPAVRGYWRTPSGAIIRIAPCGQELCVEIAALSHGNRPLTDMRNPDPKLRSRPLCGLRIGEGFVEADPEHARAGHLYDPKSGRTYKGQMTAAGNLLHLRGYVGLPLFGRTETWVRASQPPPCADQRQPAPAPLSSRAR